MKNDTTLGVTSSMLVCTDRFDTHSRTSYSTVAKAIVEFREESEVGAFIGVDSVTDAFLDRKTFLCPGWHDKGE